MPSLPARPSWLRHQHIPEGSQALQHEFQWVLNARHVTVAWYKGGPVPSMPSLILKLSVSTRGMTVSCCQLLMGERKGQLPALPELQGTEMHANIRHLPFSVLGGSQAVGSSGSWRAGGHGGQDAPGGGGFRAGLSQQRLSEPVSAPPRPLRALDILGESIREPGLLHYRERQSHLLCSMCLHFWVRFLLKKAI